MAKRISKDARPTNIDEYVKWMDDRHRVRLTDRNERHFESAARKIRAFFEKTDLWKAILETLPILNEAYYLKTGYPLVVRSPKEFDEKSYGSFLLKTFRKNVLDNDKYPDPPEDGWLLPANWYSRINDIVRTLVVVKYLDGVEFMANGLEDLAAKHGIKCDVSLEAREEGYYAAHVYFRVPVSIDSLKFEPEHVDASIELHISTELQDGIRQLLHKHYEERRVMGRVAKGSKDVKWQWNYQSDEFVANYLGHILHYVEGMIVDIRERQRALEQTAGSAE